MPKFAASERLHFSFTRRGKKEREDGEKGGEGGRLFERGDYFIYFRLGGGGGGGGGAIIRVRRLIEGLLFVEEIWY